MRKPENFVLSPEDVFRIVEPHLLIELLSEPSLLADRCSITSMVEGTALHFDNLDWSPEELVEIIIEKTEEGAYRTDITLADDEGWDLQGRPGCQKRCVTIVRFGSVIHPGSSCSQSRSQVRIRL